MQPILEYIQNYRLKWIQHVKSMEIAESQNNSQIIALDEEAQEGQRKDQLRRKQAIWPETGEVNDDKTNIQINYQYL